MACRSSSADRPTAAAAHAQAVPRRRARRRPQGPRRARAGASPDEKKALRALLFERRPEVAGAVDAEYDEFLREAPEFERHLVRSGVRVFKFWFSVSRDEQRRRFKERQAHPLKQWKLSPIDLASLAKRDAYTLAEETMSVRTRASDAPWTVVKSDRTKRVRLNAMRYLLHRLPYKNKDAAVIGPVDPLLVSRASLVAGHAEEFTPSSNA